MSKIGTMCSCWGTWYSLVAAAKAARRANDRRSASQFPAKRGLVLLRSHVRCNLRPAHVEPIFPVLNFAVLTRGTKIAPMPVPLLGSSVAVLAEDMDGTGLILFPAAPHLAFRAWSCAQIIDYHDSVTVMQDCL